MVRLSSELATHGAIDPVALPSSTSKRRMSRSAFTARTASPAPRAPPTARMPDVMLVPTISATTSATLPLFSSQDGDVGAGAPGPGRSADLLWPWPFARTTPGLGSSRARSPMARALLHRAPRTPPQRLLDTRARCRIPSPYFCSRLAPCSSFSYGPVMWATRLHPVPRLSAAQVRPFSPR